MIIRLIASVGLLYGAYTETGIFTAINLGLIVVTLELHFAMLERLKRGK